MLWRILADAVVTVHAAFVAFIVFGFAAIVAGMALGWDWVRNFRFRAVHLAAIGFVCVEALVGIVCPLTALEDWFRQNAGQARYPGDFIAYWMHWLIFYDAPGWVFAATYLAFGTMVALIFWLVPPRRRTG